MIAERSSNPCKLATTIQNGLRHFFNNHICLDGIFQQDAEKWRKKIESFSDDFCKFKPDEKQFQRILALINELN